MDSQLLQLDATLASINTLVNIVQLSILVALLNWVRKGGNSGE